MVKELLNKSNLQISLIERALVILILLASMVSMASSDPAPANLTERTIEVQIIAFNDFHGQLETPPGELTLYYNRTGKPFRVETGGVEYLATQIKALKAANPNTVIVSAGDNIGASPLVSALFHDEPTIEALSLTGLGYSAVGNHEFDEGIQELERMQYGCCHPTGGCQDGDRFVGAGFSYLAANVVNNTTGKTIFPPYRIQYIQGIPLAFIGVALKDTPSVVVPSVVRGLRFLDEADSINGVVQELKKNGVKTIIVLVHSGGSQKGLPSESINLTGPIIDIVNRTDHEVDLFVTGHTHQSYISTIDGRLVTQAGCHGQLLTDIDLVISKETGDVLKARAKNVAVTSDVPPDPEVSALVEKYSTISAPLAGQVIGSITADITRKATASGESALGDVIADTQLRSASNSSGAVVAFMNPGGIRADLICQKHNGTGGKGQPYNVTYGEAFSVQPFSNNLVTMNLTGNQIDALLEQQFDGSSSGDGSILQVSKGFSYTWNSSAPAGHKIDISSIKIDGVSIDPEGIYRIAVNNFLAEGGDGFTVLKIGTDRVCGAMDLDAFVEYFRDSSPISPGQMDRISVAQ